LEKHHMSQQQLEKGLHEKIEDLLRSCMKGQLSIADYTAMREQMVADQLQQRSNPEQALPLVQPIVPSRPAPSATSAAVRTRSYRPSKKAEETEPKPSSTPLIERMLGLQGSAHRNPFRVGSTWNPQHQEILRNHNPHLAKALQAQALNRHEVEKPIHLPETLHNPWMYGSQYSIALQSQIAKANPELALKMQAECRRMGQ
jgi:hypothetical protein